MLDPMAVDDPARPITDDDRRAAVTTLRQAAEDGRLGPQDLDRRLAQVDQARLAGEGLAGVPPRPVLDGVPCPSGPLDGSDCTIGSRPRRFLTSFSWDRPPCAFTYATYLWSREGMETASSTLRLPFSVEKLEPAPCCSSCCFSACMTTRSPLISSALSVVGVFQSPCLEWPRT